MSGPKTKTRDRILETSLALFNEFGEPNTSTNHIADEMNISPGNLYYHYRNKADITNLLFDQFERRMLELLSAAESRALEMEDMWLFLHLVFELIWDYRFLYRDLDNLLGRNRLLRRRFARVMQRKTQTAGSICTGLVDAGVMRADGREIEAVARNIVVVATYWLSFDRAMGEDRAGEQDALGRGVYQVMSLVAPLASRDMAPVPAAVTPPPAAMSILPAV